MGEGLLNRNMHEPRVTTHPESFIQHGQLPLAAYKVSFLQLTFLFLLGLAPAKTVRTCQLESSYIQISRICMGATRVSGEVQWPFLLPSVREHQWSAGRSWSPARRSNDEMKMEAAVLRGQPIVRMCQPVVRVCFSLL